MRLSKSIDIVDALAAIEVEVRDRGGDTICVVLVLLVKMTTPIMINMASKFLTKLQNFMRLKEAVTIEEIEQESHSWFNEKLSRCDIQEMLKKNA